MNAASQQRGKDLHLLLPERSMLLIVARDPCRHCRKCAPDCYEQFGVIRSEARTKLQAKTTLRSEWRTIAKAHRLGGFPGAGEHIVMLRYDEILYYLERSLRAR